MDIPADLIQLQRAFFEADQRCEQIAATLPDAREVVAGTVESADEDLAEMREAQADRLRLVMAIHRHEWWKTVENRYEARMALREAAKR